MTLDKEKTLARIDELMSKLERMPSSIRGFDIEEDVKSRTVTEQVFLGTVGLFNILYGPTSPQVKALFDQKKELTKTDSELIASGLIGFLANVKTEIEQGLVTTVMKETSGEVLADFIGLAKMVANKDNKDTAAVLASAALEDALKRLATFNGLNVQGKEMAQVVNALKGKSFLKGPQGPLVDSFVKLRNKALHAEWDKFSMEEVKSLIAFVEEFLMKNFL